MPLREPALVAFDGDRIRSVNTRAATIFGAAHGEPLQAAALRDQFFSAIAHDLRSPLQSIVLGLDQLEALHPEPAPAAHEALAVVRQAAAYLIDVGAGRATVAVRDQGPGLPAGREYLVFEPFVQLGSPGERPADVGLGLAIVKRSVEVHGGAVGARSTPGQAARFWFDLPSLPPAAASSSDPKNRPTPAAVTPTAGAPNAGGGIAGVRILVADDEDLLRSTMVRHLGRLGAVVAEARDGREALAKLRTERHDVLLLDANMPQCNGAAVLADLRREPLPHRPLVVLLSGGDLCDADGTRFEDLGADLVVQKPVRISALATAIAEALAARGR
jgi:CheY-like chemotaxis protein